MSSSPTHTFSINNAPSGGTHRHGCTKNQKIAAVIASAIFLVFALWGMMKIAETMHDTNTTVTNNITNDNTITKKQNSTPKKSKSTPTPSKKTTKSPPPAAATSGKAVRFAEGADDHLVRQAFVDAHRASETAPQRMQVSEPFCGSGGVEQPQFEWQKDGVAMTDRNGQNIEETWTSRPQNAATLAQNNAIDVLEKFTIDEDVRNSKNFAEDEKQRKRFGPKGQFTHEELKAHGALDHTRGMNTRIGGNHARTHPGHQHNNIFNRGDMVVLSEITKQQVRSNMLGLADSDLRVSMINDQLRAQGSI